MFVGERQESFAKKGDLFCENSELPLLRAEQVSFDADDVAKVKFFLDELDRGEFGLGSEPFNFSLDKDRFRRDMGGVVEAYSEVAKRLGIMPNWCRARPRDRCW